MGKVLLVVDDSRTIRTAIELVFDGSDYEVVLAESGGAGLSWMETNTPDVILVDEKMPDMDGYDFGTKVKADAKNEEVPILLLACQDGPDESRADDADLDGYVNKPFGAQELVTLVEMLTGSSVSSAMPLSFKEQLAQRQRQKQGAGRSKAQPASIDIFFDESPQSEAPTDEQLSLEAELAMAANESKEEKVVEPAVEIPAVEIPTVDSQPEPEPEPEHRPEPSRRPPTPSPADDLVPPPVAAPPVESEDVPISVDIEPPEPEVRVPAVNGGAAVPLPPSPAPSLEAARPPPAPAPQAALSPEAAIPLPPSPAPRSTSTPPPPPASEDLAASQPPAGFDEPEAPAPIPPPTPPPAPALDAGVAIQAPVEAGDAKDPANAARPISSPKRDLWSEAIEAPEEAPVEVARSSSKGMLFVLLLLAVAGALAAFYFVNK